MTNHNIKELQRQYDAARIRATEAINSSNAAKNRLSQAKLDETGLVGHIVSYMRGDEERRFVVSGFGRWSESVLAGYKIKKDGSLSTVRDDAAIIRLADHGIYEAPKK